MPYSRDNLRRIAEEFAIKKQRAEDDADNRRFQSELAIPELRGIHRRLETSGLEILDVALSGGDVQRKIDEIKAEKNVLLEKKRGLLLAAGYPADFTEPRYECAVCNDVGYVSGVMCSCMKEALSIAEIESSGLGQLVRTQSFNSFSMNYYSGKDRENAVRAYEKLKAFAEDFAGTGAPSWILMGDTGLGKTHLSSSVAAVVIRRGYNVIYTSAVELISVFERQRFGGGHPGDGTESKFYDTDLLIVDDLGTEVSNQFTLSCLYNVINSRLVSGKSTIINTNLTHAELLGRYSDRITSRILGEYIPLVFSGNDIRRQKLRK